MKVRIWVQINKDTNEKNVWFTHDLDAKKDEFMVNSWRNSIIKTGIVCILDLEGDLVTEDLVETELHSICGIDLSNIAGIENIIN